MFEDQVLTINHVLLSWGFSQLIPVFGGKTFVNARDFSVACVFGVEPSSYCVRFALEKNK